MEMTNVTTAQNEHNLDDEKYMFYASIAYISVGVFLVIANSPIFVSILRHSELRTRKEYLLLAGW
jgi:hypothetical protein